jgi:pyrroline-5-carboxylate reductase
MKIGFVGYGKMGSTIIQAILDSKAAQPNQLIIYNRTRPKLDELIAKFPDITVADSPVNVAKESELLFICTLTGTIPALLKESANKIRPNTHLVLISGALDFQYLEKQFSGAITKTIPSVTLAAGRGVTLVCHNSKATPAQKAEFQALLGTTSRLVEVSEQMLDDGADFTSTFPAFIAKMMDTWAKTGVGGNGFSKEEALSLILETLSGTAALLTDKGFTPELVMDRVATKGGNTEQGLKVLDRELPQLFSDVFEATRKKRSESKASMAKLVEK